MKVRCLLIGAGKMGSAHLRAVAALEPDGLACWAPSERRRQAANSVGARFFSGRLEAAVDSFQPTHVIVASPVDTLTSVSLRLINAGVRNLLIEKPAVLNRTESRALASAVKLNGARVYVGYNRRFYSSIRTAMRLIADAEEEIESADFDFTEVVADPAGPHGHARSVCERWVLANSLHVIDTALFPIGHPDPQYSCFARRGELVWHPTGSIFFGSGITIEGIPFTYHANWRAPGRWGFEWMTSSARYVFRPMEKLMVIHRGTFEPEQMALENDLDHRFKPGVFLQDKAFLFGGKEARNLVPLSEALLSVQLGETIGGYIDRDSD